MKSKEDIKDELHRTYSAIANIDKDTSSIMIGKLYAEKTVLEWVLEVEEVEI